MSKKFGGSMNKKHKHGKNIDDIGSVERNEIDDVGNVEGKNIDDVGDVELYYPRKCDASGRLIAARDYAAIKIDFAPLPGEYARNPETGRMEPAKVTSYVISGKMRKMGESDDCINRLATRDGLLKLGDCINRVAIRDDLLKLDDSDFEE